jgi:hypothetical protein
VRRAAAGPQLAATRRHGEKLELCSNDACRFARARHHDPAELPLIDDVDCGAMRSTSGDKVTVDCTYQNGTDQPAAFGESTLAEMCFAGLYQYPAGSTGFVCIK